MSELREVKDHQAPQTKQDTSYDFFGLEIIHDGYTGAFRRNLIVIPTYVAEKGCDVPRIVLWYLLPLQHSFRSEYDPRSER